MQERFSLPPNLDFGLCVNSGQVFRWHETGPSSWEGVDGREWYQVRLRNAGLEVESNAEAAAFRRMFRLDVDAAAVEAEILRRGPELGPLMAAHSGLRVLQPNDPVEVFFSFLCSANNHLKRIKPMVGKLAEFGDPIPNTKFRAFPEPEVVAEIPESVLRSQGFGYRGASIPRAAAALVSRGGRAWLESLMRTPYEQAVEQLIEIPSIGRKLADCIALFGLHHGEAVPVDTHLWQQLTRLYHPELRGEALTERRYREVAERFRTRFGDLTGWAHQYLFVDNVSVGARARAARSKEDTA